MMNEGDKKRSNGKVIRKTYFPLTTLSGRIEGEEGVGGIAYAEA